MKHIVCYSGGHSSALVAIEVARRHGTANLILLNHDISARVEDGDIKRFKAEVAAHIGVPVTQANMPGCEDLDQFDVSIKEQAFKVGKDKVICTARLKTEPFQKWLKANANPADCVIYYGFDLSEQDRITRRVGVMATGGWRTDYPLATWPRTIHSTREVGIEPPLTYGVFKHANCTGCIKGGIQHWYAVFCTRPDLWAKAKAAEEAIGHTIHPDKGLDEYEPLFRRMRCEGIEPDDRTQQQTWWANVKKRIAQPGFDFDGSAKPCECVF